MKCSYAYCGNDVPPNEFVLHTIDNNRFFCSVSCFLVDLKLTHIQVWGYSEGLEKDYMESKHLKLFDLKRSCRKHCSFCEVDYKDWELHRQTKRHQEIGKRTVKRML